MGVCKVLFSCFFFLILLAGSILLGIATTGDALYCNCHQKEYRNMTVAGTFLTICGGLLFYFNY
jgi:hypothetical protein